MNSAHEIETILRENLKHLMALGKELREQGFPGDQPLPGEFAGAFDDAVESGCAWIDELREIDPPKADRWQAAYNAFGYPWRPVR